MTNNFQKIKKNSSRLRIFKVAAVISGIIFIWLVFVAKPVTFFGLADGRLEKWPVCFLDVGQGDAALIETPHKKTILIDGGPDNLILRRLGEILSPRPPSLDFIILSHYHADHLTGLLEILKRYEVKNIFYPANDWSSPLLENFLDIAKSKNISVTRLIATAKIKLEDNCFLNLLNPESLGISKDQNNSLVAKLDCRSKKFLFTGDNSSKVESALLSSNFDLLADIFKAAHHGSLTANSENFLRAVNPQEIIISVGVKNHFGHPSQLVLDLIASLGIRSHRTDEEGNICIFSQY